MCTDLGNLGALQTRISAPICRLSGPGMAFTKLASCPTFFGQGQEVTSLWPPPSYRPVHIGSFQHQNCSISFCTSIFKTFPPLWNCRLFQSLDSENGSRFSILPSPRKRKKIQSWNIGFPPDDRFYRHHGDEASDRLVNKSPRLISTKMTSWSIEGSDFGAATKENI